MDFEKAMEKFRQISAKGKKQPRVQMTASIFDRAIWYSLHGASKPYAYRQVWVWPNEAAWRLRNEKGEDQGTDVSSEDEETLSASSSSQDSPLRRHIATALPFAPSGAQSELSRDQKRSKNQKKKAQESVLTTQYQCPGSDREFVRLPDNKIHTRVPNRRYITARAI